MPKSPEPFLIQKWFHQEDKALGCFIYQIVTISRATTISRLKSIQSTTPMPCSRITIPFHGETEHTSHIEPTTSTICVSKTPKDPKQQTNWGNIVRRKTIAATKFRINHADQQGKNRSFQILQPRKQTRTNTIITRQSKNHKSKITNQRTVRNPFFFRKNRL